MKRICKIFSTLLLLAMAINSNAAVKPTTLYVYGFAASFNDSTVYITNIMVLDSAWVESKNNFLYSRENYSAQLKSYLQEQGVKNPTCIISFAPTRKKAEKKYVKLRQKYTEKKGAYTIKYISEGDFKFHAISAADDPSVVTSLSKEAVKAAKKEEKEARKNKKK